MLSSFQLSSFPKVGKHNPITRLNIYPIFIESTFRVMLSSFPISCFPAFHFQAFRKLESTTLKLDSICILYILSLLLGSCFPAFHFQAFHFQAFLKLESTTLKLNSMYILYILSLLLGSCFSAFHFQAFHFPLSTFKLSESWKAQP